MESDVVTETVITLKLTELEASWLKKMVQNPMCGNPPLCPDPRNEGELERRIRKSFWDALESVKL